MFLHMVSITLSLPEDIRALMKKFPEINWSALVRKFITEKARKLALKEEMFKQLEKEKEFDSWAVNLVRDGRRQQKNESNS